MGTETRLQFRDQLVAVWRRSDELFSLIPDDKWFERPIGLRHPILFYLGHLPAFAWNQVCGGVLDAGHLDQRLDHLFARGIDPEDTAGAAARSINHGHWPSVTETIAYRDRVRKAIVESIDEVLARPDDLLCENGRILHLVIEHEVMHHETLLYMLAECPPGMIRRPEHVAAPAAGDGRPAEVMAIAAGRAVIGAAWHEIEFGWDNEFPRTEVDVPQFRIDSLPVRNADWRAFYLKNQRDDSLFPHSWVHNGRGLQVKTVFGPVPFELASGWPVQVTGEQAARYCAARGGRLPTEAELRRAAYTTPDGATRTYPWGDDSPTPAHGNFGFSSWYPAPVGEASAGISAWGVMELVGNGWEWTSTPFAPLQGFQAWARTYPGYSTDFFDDAHDVVFGASWATDLKLLRPSFRNWYRRNYPYPFTSFRVVRS